MLQAFRTEKLFINKKPEACGVESNFSSVKTYHHLIMTPPFAFREYLTDDLDKVKNIRLEDSFMNNLRNAGC
jgi:hypothetical protein